ncbi:conserved hypothetical protein [Burkholderiales bacterium 8X]|nr:conserved hypothetical protein [Burkholderiales bacterium 8X]
MPNLPSEAPAADSSPRIYFAPGSQGEYPRRLQQSLIDAKLLKGTADGIYGQGTAAAVRAWQTGARLQPTGSVDEPTWTGITRSPLPTAFERMLQVTGRMEGHGFTLAVGNFDGAGLTWGIIGFTLRYSSLNTILLRAEEKQPGILAGAFGAAEAEGLLRLLRAPGEAAKAERMALANKISLGDKKYNLAPVWKEGFHKLGLDPMVQAIQVEVAREGYFQPALATAQTYAMTTELGMALCFDIHVQNGGVKPAARQHFLDHGGAKAADEGQRRLLLAQAVASQAREEYRKDVLTRKESFARGKGTVHGLAYDMAAWGLADLRMA